MLIAAFLPPSSTPETRHHNGSGKPCSGRSSMDMRELHGEILADILLRLPVRSLGQCKCVCRRWRSLISDPHFVRSQLRASMLRDPYACARILLTTDPLRSVTTDTLDGADSVGHPPPNTELGYPVRTLDPDEKLAGFQVMASCEGLLCVLNDSWDFAVWNPTTGKCRELSNPELGDVRDFRGLSYDPQADEYKFMWGNRVAPTDDTDPGLTVVEIFTLKTNSWRKIVFDGVGLDVRGTGAYATGYLHWLIRRSESTPTDRIVSFDFSDERFHEVVLLPPIPDPHIMSLEYDISFCGGCLVLFRYGVVGTHFEAWVMKWDGRESSRTRLCRVPKDRLTADLDIAFPSDLVPIDFTRNGKLVFNFCALQLSRYDPKGDAFNSIEFQSSCDYISEGTYVESLVSPHNNPQGGPEA